ncbi:hypothetical protein [uncultured Ruegeria sp.]|uniref:hypothetical protein n=1 Tax=uncultured Ruegeria sp. TaxID=259304 RepID=UPI0026278273|nr:hypothetical protein [uncultured Ruegeria sp.]
MAWIVQRFSIDGQSVSKDGDYLFYNGERWSWGLIPDEFTDEKEAERLASDFSDYFWCIGYGHRCKALPFNQPKPLAE